MQTKKLFALLIMLSVFTAYSTENFKSVEINGMTFNWRIIDKQLEVILKAKTKGWISAGFNPSKGMKDANLIIGYVKKDKLFISDDYGISLTLHTSDERLGGVNNIIKSSGSEKDGITEIQFTIPLDSGDKYDSIITNGLNKVILAYGFNDDFTTKHAMVAMVEIEVVLSTEY